MLHACRAKKNPVKFGEGSSKVLLWQLGCALATLGKRVGGGRREILTCRNFMHHAVQPPLNWSAIGRQWRPRSRQYGSQLPRPSPRYTALNFVKGTLYSISLDNRSMVLDLRN